MMLMRWSFHVQVVAADVMVIPRSCSWTIQSIVAAPSCTSPICTEPTIFLAEVLVVLVVWLGYMNSCASSTWTNATHARHVHGRTHMQEVPAAHHNPGEAGLCEGVFMQKCCRGPLIVHDTGYSSASGWQCGQVQQYQSHLI